MMMLRFPLKPKLLGTVMFFYPFKKWCIERSKYQKVKSINILWQLFYEESWWININMPCHFHKFTISSITFCRKTNFLPIQITFQVADMCSLKSKIMYPISAFLLYSIQQTSEKYIQMPIVVLKKRTVKEIQNCKLEILYDMDRMICKVCT